MKVVKAKIGQRKFVVNNKGKRVTPKYSYVTEHKYGPFYVVQCRDNWQMRNPKPDRTYVFDDKSGEIRNVCGEILHKSLNENIFAFRIDDRWNIYTINGTLLRNDVTYIETCKNHPYFIAYISNMRYFLDENMYQLAGPFGAARDFDSYGYSMVWDIESVKCTVLYLADGKFVLKPWQIECDDLRAISEEFFLVRKNGREGIVDSNGQEILPTVYQEIKICGANHFRLKYNNKYGLADITGKIVFECFYDEILETPDKFAVKDFTRLETSKTLEVNK